MSDTGLYSSLYEQCHDYAKILNEVLVNLKSGTSKASDLDRQKLVVFVDVLAEESAKELPTRLIMLTIHDKGLASMNEWSKVREALLSDEAVEPSIIDLLERLAWVLEQEQLGAMARIGGKGW